MGKKKKEKIIYYDDGSPIADMSNVQGIGHRPRQQKRNGYDYVPPSTFFDKVRTFWSAMKMMFLPMMICMAVLTVGFLFLLAITGNLW